MIIIIIIIIIINIIIAGDVSKSLILVTSSGCSWYSGDAPQIVGVPATSNGRWVRRDGG